MKIQLSDYFNYKKLLRFTLPSIVMMVFTSIYGVVDGLFVSNIVGSTSFAAVNFIMPVLMILGAVGFMFGTGGSALVAKTMGQGEGEKAKRLFSLIVYTTAISGAIIAVIAFILMRPIASLLGAEGNMLEACVIYGRIITVALPFYMLQFLFQSFFITAEKPTLGLIVTVIAGVTNMVLDALFMAGFGWGLVGAAVATALSQVVGGIIPIFYFIFVRNGVLSLTKTKFDGRAIGAACINGSSELMSNIAMSLVSMVYNVQLLNYAGENGISAYGVLMYVNFVFISVFIGYSVGASPVIGYHYGADNSAELKSLLKKSLLIIGSASVLMFIIAELLAVPVAAIFVGYDIELYEMTVTAFRISSFTFIFAGIAIFGSSFFTALNNGLISAVISFLRTLVFQIGAVLLFSYLWGLDGIWLSIVAAEVMAVIITIIFLITNKRKYKY
ncbi:MAG: MATE family efflux transporter [Clostridia bacterium]|nr:MATE family efflux transporter [Clostridia bacterium]